jgi:hypothetical protein
VRGTIAMPSEVGFASDLAVDGKSDVYVVDSVGRRLWVARKGDAALTPLTPPLPEDSSSPRRSPPTPTGGCSWPIGTAGAS